MDNVQKTNNGTKILIVLIVNVYILLLSLLNNNFDLC
jgi:hypothetical protein